MTSIALRLWIPSDVPLDIVRQTVNSTLQTRDLRPPFTHGLQNIIDSMFLQQSRGRLVAHVFRLNFPRGPVISMEQLPSSIRRMNDEPDFANILFQGTVSGLSHRTAMLEQIHMASMPYSDTMIRDLGPSQINLRSATYRIRRPAPPQRRQITVPSHACIKVETCAICLTDTAIGETVSRLPCNHVFHKKCIQPWLRQASTCPTCRHDL